MATATSSSVTDLQAIAFLGTTKVVTFRQAHRALGTDVSTIASVITVPFTTATLRLRAEENHADTADWRLIYITGASIHQLYTKFGEDPDHQPCFYLDEDDPWWLKESHHRWTTRISEPGYYLLDFNLRFCGQNRQEHQDSAKSLGNLCKRADEIVVVEACFTNYQTHDGERLLGSEQYHWSEKVDDEGFHIIFGDFDTDGFYINTEVPEERDAGIGMVISRNPDF